MKTKRQSKSNSRKVNHPYLLNKRLGESYKDGRLSDVTLLVSGQKFKAHKLILAASNDYFETLFFGVEKESNQTEVDLGEKPIPAFEELLKYIYTGQMDLSTMKENVINLA